MKKHWLRGMLLGLSMALLLSGGVALARGTLSVDKTCVQCVPERYMEVPWEEIPYDPYGITLTGEGWRYSPKCTDLGPTQIPELYHEVRWPNGEVWDWCVEIEPDGSFEFSDIMWFCPCEEPGYEAGVSNRCVPALGEMEYYFEDDTGGRSVSVLLARECAAAFVPEPGSILLLGGGLAGLAGYATLRWRSRE